MWMGLCHFPSIQSYWSTNVIYTNFIKSIISRNRFQLLLKMWHFSDNTVPSDDRLQKIGPLINKLRESFQQIINPGEYICIDETLVPFRGRLKFKQYITNKRHKFGIKLFKLCLVGGYTYDFKVYCGKEKKEEDSVPSKVVMNLMDNLLDKGRTLCTDNYYTSVSLAHGLLQRQTHLIGTLRFNRKYNPKNVIEKKLKVGETETAQSNKGIIVQKWKDRRDVLMLSTRYKDEMVIVNKRGAQVQKPKNVVEYNKYKSYIDISDQMKSYNSPLRKGVKWYRKLAFELLLGTAVVNAYHAHQEIANEKMTITKFREQIVSELLQVQEIPNVHEQQQHKLENLGRSGRRRCVVCFAKLKNESGRSVAMNKTPQSNLKCIGCNKHFCLECFFDVHNCFSQ